MSRLRPPAPSKPKLSEKYKHLKNSNIYRVTPLIYKKGNSRFTRLFQKIIKITAVIKITLKKTFGKNISYLRLYEIFVKCSRIPKSLKISPGFLFVLFNLILKSVFEFLTKGFCERDSFFKLWDWEIIIPNKLKQIQSLYYFYLRRGQIKFNFLFSNFISEKKFRYPKIGAALFLQYLANEVI